jgi:hypothetical protein
MPIINIYGLQPPSKDDTKVFIFDEKSYGTEKSKPLYSGIPDEDGRIEYNISSSYIGQQVRIIVMAQWFKEYKEILDVEELGAFHAVRLEVDDCQHRRTDIPTDFLRKDKKVQKEMLTDYRNTKYTNNDIKLIHGFSTAYSSPLGYFIGGVTGLFVGVFITICLLPLSKYVHGEKKGF